MSPKTNHCQTVVASISLAGALLDAFWIGLIWTRMSRGGRYAGIQWTDACVVGSYLGRQALSLRVVNLRTKQLVDTSVRLFAAVWSPTTEGREVLVFHQLKLVHGSGEADRFYVRP